MLLVPKLIHTVASIQCQSDPTCRIRHSSFKSSDCDDHFHVKPSRLSLLEFSPLTYFTRTEMTPATLP